MSEEYIGAFDKLKWKCLKEDCGEIFEMSWTCIQRGYGCSYCCIPAKKVGLTNCLATKRPDLIKYLKNKDDGYKYTRCSYVDIIVKCPECGNEKNMKISNLSTKGFSCNKCGDGISYPEKFMFNVLNQLNLKFKTQLNKFIFKWCGNYKYDFYILDFNSIIETHGIQHYKQSTRGRLLKEEQQNDNIKMELALDNEINSYIIIDCRKSELEWIKNSIMQSDLPRLLNFKEEDIDWLKCHEYACNSLVKVVCDMWNDGMENTQIIANELNFNKSTVVEYLKMGEIIGLCNYDAKAERNKGLILKRENSKKQVVLLNTGEVFSSIGEAGRKYNIFSASISNCCRNKTQSAGELNNEKMKWLYYKDYLELNNEAI